MLFFYVFLKLMFFLIWNILEKYKDCLKGGVGSYLEFLFLVVFI